PHLVCPDATLPGRGGTGADRGRAGLAVARPGRLPGAGPPGGGGIVTDPSAHHARDLPRLGALEAQVMDVLWDHGTLTVREVIDHLGGAPAYTTIATVL